MFTRRRSGTKEAENLSNSTHTNKLRYFHNHTDADATRRYEISENIIGGYRVEREVCSVQIM